jgi:hypothetical protein
MGLIFVNQPQLGGNKPVLLVSRATTQTIAASTSTTIAFATIGYDNYSGYNTGVSVYLCPWTGLYRVSVSAYLNSIPTAISTPGGLSIGIYTITGTNFISGTTVEINMSAGVTYQNILSCQTLVLGTGGVTNISAQALITPAGTASILANGFSTSMQIEYVQP